MKSTACLTYEEREFYCIYYTLTSRKIANSVWYNKIKIEVLEESQCQPTTN